MTGNELRPDIFYAHTPTTQNPTWHELYRHLLGVAQIASEWGRDSKEQDILQIIAILHDLGKYQIDFQDYLKATNEGQWHRSVPHAVWGAYAAYSRFTSEEAAFVIDGHHAGIPDKSTLAQQHFERFKNPETQEADTEKTMSLLDTCISETGLKVKSVGCPEQPQFMDIRIRFLFSCLVDADWLHSESHFKPQLAEYRRAHHRALDPQKLSEQLDVHYEKLEREAESTKINQKRKEARLACLSKASSPPGFFSLVLPTGLGKTLTSFYWALHHAKENRLERIIIVLPYLNIIDQTVTQLRKVYGDEWILEHHSGLEAQTDDETHYNEKKLASENWDFPIIVTTTVQFFESLFSNKPSKCRKIHNLARSVVIFDEVQTLPKESIAPSLRMLQDVQAFLRCSFLFCTATMPSFAKRQGFPCGIDCIENLLPNPESYFISARRVAFKFINDLEQISFEQLTSQIHACKASALVILNTKKDALRIFQACKDGWDEVFYLSTSMFPRHRKIILKRIRRALKNKRRILVVTTQLVEAGVDLDFPFVFRALGPLDSIIQAAGRCNREGSPQVGTVFVFNLADSGLPLDRVYRAATEYVPVFLRTCSKDGSLNAEILHDPSIFEQYYDSLLTNFVQTDRAGIEYARKKLRFKQVAESYHIIDSPTQPVFVYAFQEKGSITPIRKADQLFKSLEKKPFLSIEDQRALQAYTVQLYPDFFNTKYGSSIVTLKNGLNVWQGFYSRLTGLGNPEVSDLIV
jgi:CRISPR-associated helicase Cas3/CRISPR-associated endonuclease Cas3-HD